MLRLLFIGSNFNSEKQLIVIKSTSYYLSKVCSNCLVQSAFLQNAFLQDRLFYVYVVAKVDKEDKVYFGPKLQTWRLK
mgnify:CR=1 FL=1